MNIWQDSNNAMNNSIPNSSTASEAKTVIWSIGHTELANNIVIKDSENNTFTINKDELQRFKEFYFQKGK